MHNWKPDGTCPKCGARRTVPAEYLRDEHEKSPFRYFLPDAPRERYGKRPSCTDKGESRRTKKAGRRAKALARSRAGGARLRTKEVARG